MGYLLIIIALIGILFTLFSEDNKENKKYWNDKYYVYMLFIKKDNVLKIGITGNLESRLTGIYGDNKFEGLIDNYEIDFDNIYYIRTKKQIAEKIEIKLLNSQDRITYGNASGKTEFLKNGKYNLNKNLKKYTWNKKIKL